MPNPFVDVLAGWSWVDAGRDNHITYYLDDSGSRAWTLNNALVFGYAAQFWANVAGITFERVFSAASADVVETLRTTAQMATAYGSGVVGAHDLPSYLPGPSYGELSADYGISGDRLFALPELTNLGSYSFATLVHELGHALGLFHPHPESPIDTAFPGVTTADDPGDNGLNSTLYTVMSYADYRPNLTSLNYDIGNIAGPMAFDIAAIQALYGANTTYASGDSTYYLGDLLPTEAWSCIWDTGGTDRIVSIGARSVVIDLRAATLLNEPGGGGFLSTYAYSTAVPSAGYTIANGVVIENATGGSGDDRLTGNDVANELIGGSGADILSGGAGADKLIGGAGDDDLFGGADDDTAVFAGALATYVGAVETISGESVTHIWSSEGLDDLVGVEFVQFSDQLISIAEFLAQRADAAPTSLQLSAELATIAESGLPLVSAIKLADITVIDDGLGSNALSLSGADAGSFEIVSGGLYLRAGVTLDFETQSSYSVTVVATDPLYASSPLSRSFALSVGDVSPETITGTSGADQLVGGADVDMIVGLAGNDTLLGNDGNDILTGGTGRDTMNGGRGLDDFDFNTVAEIGKTSTTRDKIIGFTHLQDDIDLSTIDANGSAAGNKAFTFLAAKDSVFTGNRGQVRWFQINNSGTANDKTIIEGDINGDEKADFQIELVGLKTLTKANSFSDGGSSQEPPDRSGDGWLPRDEKDVKIPGLEQGNGRDRNEIE